MKNIRLTKKKLFSLFFLSCLSIIGGIGVIGLNPYLPSVYHVYLPSFKRVLSSDTKENTIDGNLNGVITKLPYIKSLGVDYLYLSPFFKSPQMDGGYDVSDYLKVDPIYGTDEDFLGKDLKGVNSDGGLLREANKLGLKVIIDLVMNHTSYRHEWFKSAIESLGNITKNSPFLPYYYIFKQKDPNYKPSKTPPKVELLFDLDGKKKGEIIDLPWWNDSGLNEIKEHPYTAFSAGDDLAEIAYLGKEREIDGKLQPWIPKNDGKQHYYYLYTFSWFQPDLNWNNQIVQEWMAKIANFWINKGVKGFRFDAIPLIGKDIDNKSLTVPLPSKLENFLTEFSQSTYRKVKQFLTIGELSQDGVASNSNYLTKIARKLFDTAYLPLANMYYYPKKAIFPFLKNIRDNNNIKEFADNEYSLDKLNQGKFKAALLMENHDHIRSVSRFGGSINPDYIDDTGDESVHRLAWTVDKVGREKHQRQAYLIKSRAKALALFKFLQKGIPIIYNGEEIGMDNDYTGTRHDINKDEERYIELSYDLQSRYWLGLKEVRKDYVSFFYRTLGRESARTAFQWNSSNNAGFCEDCKMWNGVNEPTREDAEANYKNSPYNQEEQYLGMWTENNGKPIFNRNYQDIPDTLAKGKITLYQNNLVGSFRILNPHYKQINVQEQEQRLDSPLNFYRKLLYLRKTNSVLSNGKFKEFKNFKTLTVNNLGSKMVTAYTRSNFWGKRYLIITNLDYQSQLVNINLGKVLTYDRLLLNTHPGLTYQNNLLELQPYQGIVVAI